jgi:hypothetical protein
MKRLGMMLAACALVTVSQRAWSAEPQTNAVLRVALDLRTNRASGRSDGTKTSRRDASTASSTTCASTAGR